MSLTTKKNWVNGRLFRVFVVKSCALPKKNIIISLIFPSQIHLLQGVPGIGREGQDDAEWGSPPVGEDPALHEHLLPLPSSAGVRPDRNLWGRDYSRRYAQSGIYT